MRLEFAQIETLSGLAGLEPEWSGLWECDPRATPFQSPAWMLPWTRHLWEGGRLLAFAWRSGGGLVGLAPLFVWGYGGQPERLRVSFAGAGVTDYLDTLAAPGFECEIACALFERLAEMRGEWHEADFEELRDGSPLVEAHPPDGMLRRVTACSTCPVAPLGSTWDEHLTSLELKFRTDLRRAGNRLRKLGAARFVKAGPENYGEILDVLFRLHTTRWNERSQQGVLAGDRLRAFHRETAACMMERGMLRLYGLDVDGRWIAAQYNFAAKGRAYAYLSGFDPGWSKHSPGALLLGHSIEDAISEGIAEFDFLREREAFKYQWGARDRSSLRLQVEPTA